MRGLNLVLALLMMVTGLALAPACGSAGSQEQTTPQTQEPPPPEPVTVTVNILGNRYDPQEVTVPAGSTVIWHNTTANNHGIICEGTFDADLRPGQDFQHVFANAGTYEVRSRTSETGINFYTIVTVE